MVVGSSQVEQFWVRDKVNGGKLSGFAFKIRNDDTPAHAFGIEFQIHALADRWLRRHRLVWPAVGIVHHDHVLVPGISTHHSRLRSYAIAE